VAGNNITFAGPAPEDLAAAANSYLEVQLTATDLSSASATVARDLDPRKVDVTFATVPPGLNVNVNGATLTGPQTVTSWEGYLLTATAPLSQPSGPDLYIFSSWSAGTGNPLAITTPSSPATYTATYQLSTDVGPLEYVPLTPCRLVDTRALPGGALAAGETRALTVRLACGIPATFVRAIAVNVTVVGPTRPGHLRLYAADELRPASSTVNFSPGQTRGNNAIVRLSAFGTSGDISVYCAMASGATHFVLDVFGYFTGPQ
jgi:hypothetical protein